MARPPLPPPPSLLALGQAAVLAAMPQGGQRTARRNAWAGMSADAAQARNRREAEAAVRFAVARAERQARPTALG